ncbi:uncharacterized protein [Lepeophtheirus salmonis]|uniref:uncharacterized protein n=1 Tax=Lepeophtheirus salmonis TaxID=72036 RepID=UPI001AE43931|nr:myosin-9-like [Lepeophtheirus salmonis]
MTFFGEGKVKPDRRDNPLSSKMREPKSINLNSSYTAMNMNDPVLSKRLDNFEERLLSQDTHQVNLLEQLMQFQQENRMEMKRLDMMCSEEKSHRQRVETVIKNQLDRLSDLEDKVRLNESISRSNKSSLDQLVTHTKNIERGVSLSHQDILLKKDTQEQRINDILNKISNTDSTRESLEKMTYAAREEAITSHNRVESLSSDVKDLKDSFQLLNKMFDTRENNKGNSGTKVSDTQRSILESKILQLQSALMEIQSQVNKEIKEREIDDHSIVSRLDELKLKIDDSLRKRDEEIRNIRKTLKDSPSMSESEKQSILIKISSLEADLKRMSEQQGDSYNSSPELINKLSKIEKDLLEEQSTRRKNELNLLKKTEGESSQNKLLVQENVEGLRKIFQTENAKIQERIQYLTSDRRQLEKQVGEMGG